MNKEKLRLYFKNQRQQIKALGEKIEQSRAFLGMLAKTIEYKDKKSEKEILKLLFRSYQLK